LLERAFPFVTCHPELHCAVAVAAAAAAAAAVVVVVVVVAVVVVVVVGVPLKEGAWTWSPAQEAKIDYASVFCGIIGTNCL